MLPKIISVEILYLWLQFFGGLACFHLCPKNMVNVFELGVELIDELKEEFEGGFEHEEVVDDH